MLNSRRGCIVLTAALWIGAAGLAVTAQGTPYKLGTFAQGDRTFVGVVLNDTVVIDLAQANQAFEKENPSGTKVTIPGEMKALLAAYETGGVRARVAAMASAAAAKRPAFALEIKAVKTLPPVMPQNILNAAVNYTEHAKEMAGRGGEPQPAAKVPESIPGIWMRKPGDTRHNPYVFPKLVGTVIGNGENIQLPPERPQVDWECELAAVIGRPADHVPVERAGDYIFGYTLQNDVSDRGARGDGRHGSDWFLGKSHATFGPLGPYIVPKEFVPDPQKMPITFTLSGKVMQDSNTDRMTHTVYEMVSFVSNILKLQPGDIVSTGSPAGVGTARATPIYMKAGDTSVCTIGNIGTLTNPVVGAATPTAARQ
ncbi:MAG: fumarylacetoacetate hydrolase family protein [Acidobacteria bacterium]|nr:fumarylacetoacetate hydrolase family protein [Acidobacteriota bacterium]